MAAFWLLRLHLQSQVTKATKNQAIRGSAIAAFNAASCLRTASPPLLSLPLIFILYSFAKLKIHCFLCCSMLLYNKELDSVFLQKSVNSLFTGCK